MGKGRRRTDRTVFREGNTMMRERYTAQPRHKNWGLLHATTMTGKDIV